MTNIEGFGSGGPGPHSAEHATYESSEPNSAERGYTHFDPPVARDYYRISRELASYTHDEDIGSVILIDKAARPAYIGLVHCWRALYPAAEPRPLICFMNPIGVQPIDKLSPLQQIRGADEMQRAGVDLSAVVARPAAEIADDFRATFSELSKRKERPLLVVDTCLHSGESARHVLERLRESGFEDVRLGVVESTAYGHAPSIEPDIVFRNGATTGDCYPFGYRDEIVTKGFDRVVSSPNQHPALRRAARELRAEARTIIAEGLRRSGYIPVNEQSDPKP